VRLKNSSAFDAATGVNSVYDLTNMAKYTNFGVRLWWGNVPYREVALLGTPNLVIR